MEKGAGAWPRGFERPDGTDGRRNCRRTSEVRAGKKSGGELSPDHPDFDGKKIAGAEVSAEFGMNANVDQVKDTLTRARQEVGKVIIGQSEVVDKALITIFTGHHALIEGVPGVAKTLLVRTLARVLGCDFARIQFTPDLMPADITGTNVFNLQRNEFTLIPGPVFTSFLLADEINRPPANTQSALLQAMQERLVTIDRDTHALSPNFTVFATQNPIEYEWSYPTTEVLNAWC